jgi:hypothetical protein
MIKRLRSDFLISTILCFCLFCLSLPSCESSAGFQNTDPYLSNYQEGPNDGYSWAQRKIHYTPRESLSQELLLSTIWQPQSGSYYLLVFYRDDQYKLGAYDSGVWVQGSYEITENTVVLKAVPQEDIQAIFSYSGTETGPKDLRLKWLATDESRRSWGLIGGSSVQFFPRTE